MQLLTIKETPSHTTACMKSMICSQKTDNLTGLSKIQVPDVLLPWLHATGSLTKKFEQLACQPLIVQPQFEGFLVPSLDVQRKLYGYKKQAAWVRDVHLVGNDNECWAVARSIFPQSVLRGELLRLRHLGSTPLGYLLFGRHKPTSTRTISTTMINSEVCFTRNNFYCWHGKTILVQETFLPAFIERLQKL